MKKNVQILVALVVFLLVVTSGVFAWQSLVKNDKSQVKSVVSSFYESWVNYPGNPIVARAYEESDLVSEEFKTKTNELISSFDRGGYDPVMCAQDIPQNYFIKQVEVDGGSALALVEADFSGSKNYIEVKLSKKEDAWLITEINCRQKQEQQQEENNIGENISIWQKEGNLVGEENAWSLLYEKPGQPALSQKLEFNKQSECKNDGAVVDCETGLQLGDRVKIKGFLSNGVVQVERAEVINRQEVSNFIECQEAGYEVLYPDCEGCAPYCETPSGERFEQDLPPKNNQAEASGKSLCVNECGNGVCQEMVCMGEGCPCAETAQNCPEDCR